MTDCDHQPKGCLRPSDTPSCTDVFLEGHMGDQATLTRDPWTLQDHSKDGLFHLQTGPVRWPGRQDSSSATNLLGDPSQVTAPLLALGSPQGQRSKEGRDRGSGVRLPEFKPSLRRPHQLCGLGQVT